MLANAITGDERTKPQGHTKLVESLALTPKGATLATGAQDSTLKIWDFGTPRD
jgi:WD40 repeat protein